MVIAHLEPRHSPVAVDCAKRDSIMLPIDGLHIVVLAEANSGFSGSLSGSGR
jgi:hypothetical protein